MQLPHFLMKARLFFLFINVTNTSIRLNPIYLQAFDLTRNMFQIVAKVPIETRCVSRKI